jgi:hypothetical protein
MEVGFSRKLRADDQALDVRGPLVDRADPHIAIEALEREVVEVAVAAVPCNVASDSPLATRKSML